MGGEIRYSSISQTDRLLPKLGEQRVVLREGVAHLGKHIVRVKLQGGGGWSGGVGTMSIAQGFTYVSYFPYRYIRKARFMGDITRVLSIFRPIFRKFMIFFFASTTMENRQSALLRSPAELTFNRSIRSLSALSTGRLIP